MTYCYLRLAVALAAPLTTASSQQPAAWHDPSNHQVRLVNVEEGVRLEVLDWGGPGRAVVLLAGSGNTAHVFDDFAPKLARRWHVYGVTRRGYGASSQPASGYGDQRLADDVVRVLEALAISRPVLAGHSMAGGELTTIGHQHSDRISGLVYLDALGDPRDWPASDPAYLELYRKLPSAANPPAPAAQPEAEVRNSYEMNPDGSRGRFKTPAWIHQAIGDGQKKRDYSGIRAPVLAFFEFVRPTGDGSAEDAFRAATGAYIDSLDCEPAAGSGRRAPDRPAGRGPLCFSEPRGGSAPRHGRVSGGASGRACGAVDIVRGYNDEK